MKIRNWELWKEYTYEKVWRNHYLGKHRIALVEFIIQKPSGVNTWHVYMTWIIPNLKYHPPYYGSNDSFHEFAKFKTKERAEAFAIVWMKTHPKAGIK